METEPSTWIDGVPVFWTETGRPRLTASLIFRQGVADEDLPSSGWTHLVEHLCLHDRDHGGLAVNGSTGLLETSLDLQGAPDVVTALESITSWLASPDLSRLPQEAMVLRAEGQTRNSAGVGETLGWRYGAGGPGVLSVGELGLLNATQRPIDGWIRERFTAQNAVLVLDGPPPPDLRLKLPPGERRAIRPAAPLAIDYPSGYPGETADLVTTGVLRRSTAAQGLAAIAERLLTEELRNQAAGAYAPGSFLVPVDGENVLVGLYSDFSADLASTIFDRWSQVLDRLRSGQYEPTMINDWTEAARQTARDPYAAFAKITAHASRFLGRRPALSDAEWEHEISALDQQTIATLTEQWLTTQLAALPPGFQPPGELPILRRPAVKGARGSKYQSRVANPARPGTDVNWLTVNDDGVQLLVRDDRVGIRYADLAGLVRMPDGGRVLIDRSGWSTRIEPTLWLRGRKAVAQVDQHVPEQSWIATAERPATAIPRARRMSNAARWVDLIIGLVAAVGFGALGTLWTPLIGVVIGLFIAAMVVASAIYYDRLPDVRRQT